MKSFTPPAGGPIPAFKLTGNTSRLQRVGDVPGTIALSTDSNGYFQLTSSGSLLMGRVTDAPGVVVNRIDTWNAHVEVGARLLSIQNDGAEKAYIDQDGNAYVGYLNISDGVGNTSQFRQHTDHALLSTSTGRIVLRPLLGDESSPNRVIIGPYGDYTELPENYITALMFTHEGINMGGIGITNTDSQELSIVDIWGVSGDRNYRFITDETFRRNPNMEFAFVIGSFSDNGSGWGVTPDIWGRGRLFSDGSASAPLTLQSEVGDVILEAQRSVATAASLTVGADSVIRFRPDKSVVNPVTRIRSTDVEIGASSAYGTASPSDSLRLFMGPLEDETAPGAVGDGTYIKFRGHDEAGVSLSFAAIHARVASATSGAPEGVLNLAVPSGGGFDASDLGDAYHLQIGTGTLRYYQGVTLVKDLLAPELPTARINLGTSANIYTSGESGAATPWYASHVFDTAHVPDPSIYGENLLDIRVNGVSKSFFDKNGTLRTYNIDTPDYNKLYMSSDLTNGAWWSAASGVGVAGGEVAPDGTATAFALTKTTTNPNESLNTLYNGAVPTNASIYVKGTVASTTFSIDASLFGSFFLEGPGVAAYTSGTLITITGLSLTEWTRVIVPGNASGATAFYLYPGGAASTTVGDSILVWGPQITHTSWVEPYQPTTNQVPASEIVIGGTHATYVSFGGTHRLQTGRLQSLVSAAGPGFVFDTQVQISYGNLFQFNNATYPALWMDQTFNLNSAGHIYCHDYFLGANRGTVWAEKFLSISVPALLGSYGGTARLLGGMADGVTAVSVVIDHYTGLATPGAKLLSIRNATVEKAYVDLDGGFWAGAASGVVTSFQVTHPLGTANNPYLFASYEGYSVSGASATPSNTSLGVGNIQCTLDLLIYNTAPSKSVTLQGSQTAGAAGADVILKSQTTRSAGKLISIQNNAAEQAYVSPEGSYILTTGLWDDVPCRAAQAGGVTALTQEVFRDTLFEAYFFRHDQDDTLHLEWQMPHSWDPTTSVKPHIHIIPMVSPAASENIRFTGKYVWAQVGVAVPADASWTAFTVDHAVGTTDGFKPVVIPLATVAPPSNPKESNILMMWLRRPGSSDAADTYTTSKGSGTNAANVMVASIDTHFQKVKAGTVPEIP